MATVLLADDSAVVRHHVGALLRAQGITVVEAAGMTAALALDAADIDVALLDIDLGDGDGVTVAEALRSKRAQIPLAFYSSETAGPLFSRAGALAMIFSKDRAEDAVAWAVKACAAL